MDLSEAKRLKQFTVESGEIERLLVCEMLASVDLKDLGGALSV